MIFVYKIIKDRFTNIILLKYKSLLQHDYLYYQWITNNNLIFFMNLFFNLNNSKSNEYKQILS